MQRKISFRSGALAVKNFLFCRFFLNCLLLLRVFAAGFLQQNFCHFLFVGSLRHLLQVQPFDGFDAADFANVVDTAQNLNIAPLGKLAVFNF